MSATVGRIAERIWQRHDDWTQFTITTGIGAYRVGRSVLLPSAAKASARPGNTLPDVAQTAVESSSEPTDIPSSHTGKHNFDYPPSF
jgi:hypothetical protein